MFNVESPAEIDLIDRVARTLGRRAPVAMRVNPDVDPKTHPYISTGLRTSKFGIAIERCTEDYSRASKMPGIEIVGADCHIGSQLTSTEPFAEAVARMTRFRSPGERRNPRALSTSARARISTTTRSRPPHATTQDAVTAWAIATPLIIDRTLDRGNSGILLSDPVKTRHGRKNVGRGRGDDDLIRNGAIRHYPHRGGGRAERTIRPRRGPVASRAIFAQTASAVVGRAD